MNRIAIFVMILQDIIAEIFSAALILYCSFLLIETFKPGFVRFFIDLEAMVILVFGSGVLAVAMGGFSRVSPRDP